MDKNRRRAGIKPVKPYGLTDALITDAILRDSHNPPAPLRPYVAEAYKNSFDTQLPTDILATSRRQLLQFQPNRILLYLGAFNPPHRGHLNLIRHVFDNAGDDLNIVLAIISPMDDDRLLDKFSDENNPLLLTQKQRITLWKAHGLPPNIIVWERPEGDLYK